MTGYFITGTGTEIGKTLVACALVWQIRQRDGNAAARAVKPVISGFDTEAPESTDTGQLLAAMGQGWSTEAADKVSPWRFTRPVSPHLAAGDQPAEPARIEAFCHRALEQPGITFIEGAGGLMTPLAPGYTQLDLAEKLAIPVVLVAGTYLGAMSHSLTALEALKARGLRSVSVLVSETFASGGSSLEETCDAIAQHAPMPARVVPLRRLPPAPELWKTLPPLLELLKHD